MHLRQMALINLPDKCLKNDADTLARPLQSLNIAISLLNSVLSLEVLIDKISPGFYEDLFTVMTLID